MLSRFTNYGVVKSMLRLLSKQTNKHGHKMYFCHFCLQGFGRNDLLDKHLELCSGHDPTKTIFPSKDKNILQFRNFQNCLECPIKIFADFESILAPMEETSGEIKKYQKHTPVSFAMYVVSRVGRFDTIPIVYNGSNGEKVFVEKLEDVTKFVHQKFPKPVPMLWTKEAMAKHNTQNKCYSCGVRFKPIEKDFRYRKVRDHRHYTGKYRVALHSLCNLKLKDKKEIPVLFHNLRGNDSHLFVRDLANTPGGVNCIPCNEENYITFNKYIRVGEKESYETNKVTGLKEEKLRPIWYNLRFLDTMKFLPSSLDKLV